MTHWRMTLVAGLLATASALGPAHAQDIGACAAGPDPKAAVAACSTLVDAAGADSSAKAAALVSRGMAWQKAGDLQRAAADFDAAVELKPDLPEAYFARGNLHLLGGGSKEELTHAISDYDRALELRPDYPEAAENRLLAYRMRGDPDG